MLVTQPIEFSFDAPTWSVGKSMAAHIAIGRIGEVYNKYLKDTIVTPSMRLYLLRVEARLRGITTLKAMSQVRQSSQHPM